jgi:hypothetical protein
MPRLAPRNLILILSAIALASCLTGLLPASASSADRPATKAETAAIKHVVLTGQTCRPSPAGPCEFRNARVSRRDARFAWADVVREGLSGALLKRPTARSLRFRVIGTQGGGIGACSYWRALAPAGVLRDLDVVGVTDDSGTTRNCGKLPNPPASAAASRLTLGSKRFASEVPQYLGAGQVRPKVIGDGNTCEGQASQLTWKHWGSKRATATGSMCDSPQGCISACAQPSSAQAVAYDLGRCTAHGPRVYRRAKARVRDVDTGRWSSWSSLNTFGAGGRLCRSSVK